MSKQRDASRITTDGINLINTDLVGQKTILGITGSGVESFNTRTGAVTLTSGDVTTALGFTPSNQLIPTGNTIGAIAFFTTESPTAVLFIGETRSINQSYSNYSYILDGYSNIWYTGNNNISGSWKVLCLNYYSAGYKNHAILQRVA